MTMPLLIGGATTSRVHTALRIDPAYTGPVVHVLDASRAVGVCTSLVSDTQASDFAQRTKADYETYQNLQALHRGAHPPAVHRMIERHAVSQNDDLPLLGKLELP